MESNFYARESCISRLIRLTDEMITVSGPVRKAIFMQIQFYPARASTRTIPSSTKISVAFKIAESETFSFFASMVAEISVKNASEILLLISFAILSLFS